MEALPYGRKHGEVLCDEGSSPYGTDKKEPTAELKSCVRIPQDRYNGFQNWTAYMKA